ncbi:5-oxoprolinase subunit PxpB [Bacillus sp. AK031]
MRYTIAPLGDSAVIVDFQIEEEEMLVNTISSFSRNLSEMPHEAFIEAVPAYKTVTIHYNPLKLHSLFPYSEIEQILVNEIDNIQISKSSNENEIITIPVCYGGKFGPDLNFVADSQRMTENKVIEIHSRPIYTVAFLGFSPGFPFLRGMDPSIAVPRRSSPRVRIEAGSVGIAGSQTGVYPISSPGGWQIIGKTPLALFDPDNSEPALLKQGDRIQFKPISRNEFNQMEGC